MQAKGFKSRLIMEFESTFGVSPVSPVGIRLPFNRFDVKGTQAQNEPGTITGNRNPVEPFLGNIDVNGQLVVPIDKNGIGYWLTALFGEPTTVSDDIVAGALTHDEGNTGDADLSEVTVTPDDGQPVQTWTFTVTNADTPGSEVWSVVGSESGAKANLTTAVAYDNDFVALTVPAATGEETPWAVGDILTVELTAGTGALFTHVFKVTDTQPSMVMERGFTDIGKYALYNGCKVNTFEVSFGGDGELTASMGIMGAKETIGASEYDSSPDSITFVRFNNFQASIKEGGSTIAIVKEGNFKIDAGLDGDGYVVGGLGFRGRIPEGMIGVSGSITALFEDSTLLDKAIAGTESSLELTFTSGAHSLKFLFPELLFERNTPGIDGPKGVLIELPWRGYYADDSNASAVVATLVNTVEAYELPA